MIEPEVIVRVENGVGRLTLNRPKAIHALTTGMCQAVTDALLEWEKDAAVRCVLIDHAGERGFCAGGDIRLIQESGQGDGKAARAFFATEYRMNELLFRYGKPTLAVLDGIVMGGGVGISAPCRYRLATERTLWAMPEADIGLYPDVGAGWYLPRLPAGVGAWLALTAARLRGADATAVGVATHFAPSEQVEAIKAAVVESGDPAAVLSALAPPTEDKVTALLPDIARLFSAPTVEAVEADLAAEGSEWAAAQLKAMTGKCPTTQKVSLRLIAAGLHRQDFADEMAAEYRISCRMVHRHDFIEGVRALIIDKDGAPSWSPDTLAGVTEELLGEIFADLPPDEEWTPLPHD